MSGKVQVKILGAKASAKNIREMTKAARKAYFDSLVRIAEAVMVRARDVYAPIDSGDLRRTAKMNSYPGKYPTVEIGFGGGKVTYAAIQHENVLFNHTAPTRAKYLEAAVDDYKPTMESAIALATRHEMKKWTIRGLTF